MALRSCDGFTYIGVLFLVAFMGIALAAAGSVWSQARQREKERELLFAGNQLRQAITSYYEATPGVVKQFPKKLEDLLQDNRFPGIRRHLRRIFRDPITGSGKWGLVKGFGDTIVGVYSLSDEAPLKTSGFDNPDAAFEGKRHYHDWRFTSPRWRVVPATRSSPVAAELPESMGPASPPGETLQITSPAAPPQVSDQQTGLPPESQDSTRCNALLLRARTACFAVARRSGADAAAGCFQSATEQYVSCLK